MKKGLKVVLNIAIVLSALALVALLSGIMLIEPKVKINGFAVLDKARLENVNKTVTVLDNDGNTVNDAIYDNNKIFTDINSLPDHTAAAFIAVEDKRFYSHHGVDYLRMISAAKNNLFSGSFKEGASTITQQLVKNTHLKNDKTISRKIQEIRIARDLERHYTKDEILEMYLNILYFGNNIYGIGTASYVLFDKSPSELSLHESALLAAIINNPSRFNPYSHPDAALSRRNSVLEKMRNQGYISSDECKAAQNEELVVSDKRNILNQYINNCIVEAENILGIDKSDLFSGGYTILSYYDSGLQGQIDKMISDNTVENGIINIIIADNENGRFLANSGNSLADLSCRKRQPGSTIKPFVSYAPALEMKNVYTVTPVLDEKTTFGDWTPSNFNDKYYGWVSVEDSLVKSLNVPAVKLMEMNGVEQSKKMAGKFGITFSAKDTSLAVALGGLTDGITLNTLTDAYRTFANGGLYSKGKYVREIIDKNGKTVYCDSGSTYRRAISEDNAYLMTEMLQKCAKSGTAKQVGYANYDAAAKTGTAGNKDGNTDAYCVAYTPKYTVSVHISAIDGLLNNSCAGGTLPAKLARKILTMLNDKSKFCAPETIISADIDLNELINNKKVMLASEEIKEIDKKKALFSSENMPLTYSTPQTYIEKESPLDDFDNFKILD